MLRQILRRAALFACLLCLSAAPASAHIKWFNDKINLMIPPRSLDEVLTLTPFGWIFGAAVAVLFAASLLDSWLVNRHTWIARRLACADRGFEGHTYLFLRVLVAVFFAILGSEHSVLLTPESTTSAWWVANLQYGIALTALLPATGWIAATGIVLLYGMGIEGLGLFHMLDYPAFLGAAAYLALMSLKPERHVRALAILRISTALTLMVGAAEKFGYPDWSFQMLRDYPVLRFGVDDLEFYMAGAGIVEFALAYLVLVGRLSGKAGSALLFCLMAAAILLFGWMDFVGHALFLAALFALTWNRNPIAERMQVRGRHGVLATAALSSLLFAALVPAAVAGYRYADLHLVTMCSTQPNGVHIHR
ncbi:hypothetical protein [Derxia gummosa]|uniref:Uncharacterized protein n=1 Tax=Derxia gummosa DSM 723 TaxID=1121388 RepID=A0A8B6X879_9BURK|nr:hypothetical protein [Derxia gummosa]